MSTKPFPILYQFDIALPREVDQVNTRIEGEGAVAKTVTETTKVTKTVKVPVCLKRPSRIEREEADLERAVWETHFVTKGILPQALLLKTYANHGGILSEEQKKEYYKMLADYDLSDLELRRLLVNEPENTDGINLVAQRKVELKELIIRFKEDQAVFFENTAEARARQKLIQWLVLHLSYTKAVNPDESLGEWTPVFPGKTTDEKLVAFDQIVDEANPLFAKSRSMLEFLATVLASSDGTVSKEEVEAFAETLRDES